MKLRCPTAKLYGVGDLKDYELQFKGMRDHAFATIAPSVPVALWKLKPDDEAVRLSEARLEQSESEDFGMEMM